MPAPDAPKDLAGAGVLTRTAPSAQHNADIAFGMPIVRRLSDLNIGQAIAVKEREVIAVEAIEGTRAMIGRAGLLCPAGKWLLMTVARRPGVDAPDYPCVGVDTIEQLKAHGGTCLAVEANRVFLLERDSLFASAERAGIAIVGVAPQGG